jgi:alkylation response protein AidB-like acyl-CoA dehydrogenase
MEQMDFALSEQQRILQDSVAAALATGFSLRQLHALIDGARADGARERFDKLGLWGLPIDPQYDGAGLELIDAALAAERIGYAAAAVPVVNHWLAALAISDSPDHDVKSQWLPPLAAGQTIATVALAEGEGEGCWLPDDWRLRGQQGRLSGEKWFVGDLAPHSLVVVGLAGGELGLVAPDAPGIGITMLDGVDRTRPIARLQFSDTPFVPLGCPSTTATRVVDAALTLTAADAFGGARRLLDMTTAYLTEREQFGTKLVQFQAIKHQLANIALEVEPCRALYWYAAHAFDHRRDECSASAALAKAHICDRFLQASRDCIELHGGIGFTWDYDAHIWLKRAMFDAAAYGSTRRHRERYADLVGW